MKTKLNPKNLIKAGYKKQPFYYFENKIQDNEYPKITYQAYIKKIRPNISFGVVYTRCQYEVNTEIEEMNHLDIIFGDFYPLQVEKSDIIPCDFPESIEQLEKILKALIKK